jgi:uncharacterized SAM-binding protein YcdF (DUF218 family)
MGSKNRSKNRSAKRGGKNFKGLILSLLKIGTWFLVIIGFFACLAIIISFTDIPYYAYYRLGTTNARLTRPPELIVILSGSGMPSPDGLIRTYYGAQAARQYPDAKIIIALPYDEGDNLKPLKLMAYELTIKGIDSSRIQFEPLGFNTRSQAVNIAARYPGDKRQLPVVLVTSPEHTYRSVKTFMKAGFANVGGLAAFDKPIEPEKAMDTEKTKDIRVKSLSLRYNMWSYLHYELIVIREYCAIAYYRLKGWI